MPCTNYYRPCTSFQSCPLSPAVLIFLRFVRAFVRAACQKKRKRYLFVRLLNTEGGISLGPWLGSSRESLVDGKARASMTHRSKVDSSPSGIRTIRVESGGARGFTEEPPGLRFFSLRRLEFLLVVDLVAARKATYVGPYLSSFSVRDDGRRDVHC